MSDNVNFYLSEWGIDTVDTWLYQIIITEHADMKVEKEKKVEITLLIPLTICGQISILRGVKIRRKRRNWDLNRLNTVIISPVVEEILFRGIFYEWVLSLDMNNKEKLFIIVSGGVFALLHNYSNLKQLIEKFCVGGIIYSHIFLWNKNLFLVIMVHVFHNLFVVYLTESYLEGVDCGGK